MDIILLADHIDEKLQYVLRQFLNFTTLDIEITLGRLPPIGNQVNSPCIAYAHNAKDLEGAALSIYRSDNLAGSISSVAASNFDGKDFFVNRVYANSEPLISHENNRVSLKFDIFAQIFYQLTCGGEFLQEKRNTAPNVNILFLMLENVIEKAYNAPRQNSGRYPGGKNFAVVLTHDVDSPEKTVKERFKHLWHGANRALLFLRSGGYRKALYEMFLALYKFIRPQEYNNINYLTELERSLGVKSSFNIYAMTEENKRGLKQWFYNPEYNIAKDKALVSALQNAEAKGFEIGLHGSCLSGENPLLLQAELQKLENIIHKKILGGRQHFLNYSVMATPAIFQNAGIKYDTSVGFRDINGFRAGACLPYYLYSLPENKVTDVLEIPLVVMDGVLFDHMANTKESAWASVLEILEKIRAAQGCGSIVWHQRVFNNKDYPFWEDIYRMAVQWVLKNNGALCRPFEINNFWREKEKQRNLKVI